MGQFEFKSGLVLSISGQEFEIFPDSPDFIEGWKEDCDSIAKMAEEMRKGKRSDTSVVREACDKVIEVVDNALGEGATESIFGDRPIGFYDLMDVYHHITNEIKGYQAKRQAEAVPVPVNREQRRAAAKKAKPAASE